MVLRKKYFKEKIIIVTFNIRINVMPSIIKDRTWKGAIKVPTAD